MDSHSAGVGAADLANPACIICFLVAADAELFDAIHHLTPTVRCLKLMHNIILEDDGQCDGRLQ